jgi:hypothetical protein
MTKKTKKKVGQKSVKELSIFPQVWKNGDSKRVNLNIFEWIVSLKDKIL